MQMQYNTNTEKLFGYAFTFIDAHRLIAHAPGSLTYRERTEIEQLAGGKLEGQQKLRMLRFVADKPAALHYLGALLRSNDRR